MPQERRQVQNFRQRSCQVMPIRVCVVCGRDLTGRRSDALACSPACRAEASRLRRILRGEVVDGYLTIDQRIDARQRRTRRATGSYDRGTNKDAGA